MCERIVITLGQIIIEVFFQIFSSVDPIYIASFVIRVLKTPSPGRFIWLTVVHGRYICYLEKKKTPKHTRSP